MEVDRDAERLEQLEEMCGADCTQKQYRMNEALTIARRQMTRVRALEGDLKTTETNLNNLAQHADLLHDQRDEARAANEALTRKLKKMARLCGISDEETDEALAAEQPDREPAKHYGGAPCESACCINRQEPAPACPVKGCGTIDPDSGQALLCKRHSRPSRRVD